MICIMCKKAGDASTKSRSASGRDVKDYSAKAKTLHTKCNSSNCYCQHRK